MGGWPTGFCDSHNWDFELIGTLLGLGLGGSGTKGLGPRLDFSPSPIRYWMPRFFNPQQQEETD